MFAVCRRLTGNDADAADAAQDAMIAIARGLRSFDRRSQFSTWSYRVAVNASLDELRRRRRRPLTPLPVSAPSERGRRAGASSAMTGGTGTEEHAARLDVDAALLRVAPEFRAPVVLRDLCGLDYVEIGDVLRIPPGTVRSRIARGRAALVRLLAEAPDG